MKICKLTVNNKARRGLRINALLIVVSLVVAFGLGEAVLRYYYSDLLIIYEEERSLLYRYDEKLGWFPKANSTSTFTGSRTIEVAHNSRGFRDREHLPREKPGLLFIGDSFVWGYDVEAEERFTEKLRPVMPEWDIFNLGVSGYSTDQELLLIMDQFDYYSPRIVFLVFCTYNDEMENTLNSIYHGMYYKPYFDINENMALKGIPVPMSLSYFGLKHPLLANSYVVRLIVKTFAAPLVTVDNPTRAIIHQLKEFVAQRGALLVIGMVESHGFLEHFLTDEGIPYVQMEGADRFPSHVWHWTPAGHTTVSSVIYNFLQNQGLLNIANENRN